MKKINLIFAIIMSSFTFSYNIPVKISTNTSIAYGKDIVKVKDFESSTLNEYLSEDLKYNDYILNFNTEIMYPLVKGKHQINLGGGFSFEYRKKMLSNKDVIVSLNNEISEEENIMKLKELINKEVELEDISEEYNNFLSKKNEIYKTIRDLLGEIKYNQEEKEKVEEKLEELSELEEEYPRDEEGMASLKEEYDRVNEEYKEATKKLSETSSALAEVLRKMDSLGTNDEEFQKYIKASKGIREINFELELRNQTLESSKLDLERAGEELNEARENNDNELIEEAERKYNNINEKVSDLENEILELNNALNELNTIKSEFESTNLEKVEKYNELENERQEKSRENLEATYERDNKSIERIEMEIKYGILTNFDEIEAKNKKRQKEVNAKLEVLESLKEEMIEAYNNYFEENYSNEEDEEVSGYDEDNDEIEIFNEEEEKFDEKIEELENLISELKNHHNNYFNEREKNNVKKSIQKNSFNIDSLGLSTYAKLEYQYNFDNFSLFLGTKLGFISRQNPVYIISKRVEKDNVTIDNTGYIVPKSVKTMIIKPLISAELGIKYRGAKVSIFSNFINEYIGLSFGYEF